MLCVRRMPGTNRHGEEEDGNSQFNSMPIRLWLWSIHLMGIRWRMRLMRWNVLWHFGLGLKFNIGGFLQGRRVLPFLFVYWLVLSLTCAIGMRGMKIFQKSTAAAPPAGWFTYKLNINTNSGYQLWAPHSRSEGEKERGRNFQNVNSCTNFW